MKFRMVTARQRLSVSQKRRSRLLHKPTTFLGVPRKGVVERGDTLVEVLMAIVILGTVIVGAILIMSQGLTAAQTALEHSQVRLSVNAQIEMLSKVRDEYARDPSSAGGLTWQAVVAGSNDTSIDYSGCTPTTGKQTFYMQGSGGVIERNDYEGLTPATVALPNQGIWVESVLSTGLTPAFVDFVIRACWQGIGSTEAEQRTVTAVRLYDPSR